MESLRMMGWGLVVAENSSAAVAAAAAAAAVPAVGPPARASRPGAARPSLPPWGRPPEPPALAKVALGLPHVLKI